MMRTSFAAIGGNVVTFAADLAASGRVFTLAQVARHPQVSQFKYPVKRASDLLGPYRDMFDVMPYLHGRPFLWRLTEAEKRKRGLKYRNVGPSQHTEHWLAIGDMWMQLVFNGLRPTNWFTEGKDIGGFDVFMTVAGVSYLVEVQLYPLKAHEWKAKWNQRGKWGKLKRWTETEWAVRFTDKPPRVLLVTREPMQNAIDTLPRAVQYVKRMEQLHWELRKSP